MTRTAPLAALAALLAGCSGEAPRTVLLVSLDTARADALAFDDAFVAPRLHRLAERGTVFEQAVSGTSWTLPSHVQMFTGQTPMLHGVQNDDVRVDPSQPMLAERLRDAGFFTAGVYSGWYLMGDFGFDRGFDVYYNALAGGEELLARWRDATAGGDPRRAEQIWGTGDLQSHRDVSSPRIVEMAQRAIQQAGGDDLFLFLHFFDPHYDYVPPPPYDTRFDPDYTGDIDGSGYISNEAIYDPDRGGRQVSDEDLEHLVALYVGELAWTDEHVGQVLDLLRAEGRLDETLVVVVGDHGEEFFEHGGRGHRHTLYDEQLRVPFLVVPPESAGVDPPARVVTQVTLSDVAPTVLDHLGLEPLPSTTGRSLLPAVRGEALADEPALSALRLRPLVVPEKKAVKHELRDSWRTPTEKLVRRVGVRDGGLHLHEARWYDLAADPGETRPVTDLDDPRLAAAWEALEAENAELRALWEAGPRTAARERSSLARTLFAPQLEALGYVDPGEALPGAEEFDALQLPWGLAPLPAFPLEAARAQR